MRFGESILRKIFIALAMAVPAMAVDVAPMYFKNIPADSQQGYWNYLMKYKMFGQEDIMFNGQNIQLPDEAGWFGTATGGFTLKNGNHVVGGPVLIGNSIKFESGDGNENFSSGPLRVLGDVTVNNWNSPNYINGDVCVQGSVSDKFKSTVTSDSSFWGAKYSQCPDSVPKIKTDLSIPLFDDAGVSYGDEIVVRGKGAVAYIDVPKADDGSKKAYDIYIKKISLYAESKVIVRMQSGGRWTRVFLKEGIYFENHGRIQIMYMDKNAKFEGGQWVGSGSIVENKNYKGDLLFYTTAGYDFPARTKEDTLQGTFITTGLISIKQQMTLAGQLLADSIFVDANFDGSGFIYKPFGSPEIDPTALANGKFKEDNENRVIPISLDTITNNKVTFNYCFDVVENPVGDTASIADFNKKGDGSADYPEFPICSKGESGEVVIPEKSKQPQKKVYLNVKMDQEEEPTEYLKLKIFNLAGAVLPDESDGIFILAIENTPVFHFEGVKDHYDINENSAVSDTVAKIAIEGGSATELVVDFADIKSASDKNPVKFGDLFNVVLDKSKKFVAITVKNHDELNYESARINLTYDIKLELKDHGGTEGCQVETATTQIRILDVNEKPLVNDTTFTINENLKNKSVVGEIIAVDPDTKNVNKFGHVEYEIVDKVPFTIANPLKGVITVSDYTKLDYETVPDHKFVFDVKVKNCELKASTGKYTEKCLDTLSHVTVVLKDVNEPPEIIDDGKSQYDVIENSETGYVIAKLEVVDVDAADVASKLRAYIKGNDNVANVPTAEQLFNASVVTDKSKLYVVISVKDSSLLDYETVKSSYNITLTLKDRAGAAGGKQDTVVRTIKVIDENEAPTIADTTFTPDENTPNGTVIGTLRASDPDVKNVSFSTLSYKILESGIPFTLSKNKVAVKDSTQLDYEKNPKITFHVQVSDGTNKDTALVTVILKDVNEPPVIIDDGKDHYDVKENTKTSTVFAKMVVTDEDKGQVQKLKATLTDNNSTGADSLFAVTYAQDTKTKEWVVSLVVKDSSKLDYEKVNPTHVVTVTMTDQGGKQDTVIRTINVIDVNEAPVISSVTNLNKEFTGTPAEFTLYPKENLKKGDSIGVVNANDPDVMHVKEFGHLEYSIVDPNGKVPFVMSNDTIKVKDASKLNFELADNLKYVFDVKVTNCEWNVTANKATDKCLETTKAVTVVIQNVPEKPDISCKTNDPNCNGPYDVIENSKKDSVIHEFLVSDEDRNQVATLAATLTDNNGKDAATLFKAVVEQDTTTKEWFLRIKVKGTIDYEKINSSYSVKVTVKDADGLTDTLMRTINIIDVNEKPTLEDNQFKPKENLPNGTVIGSLVASDPDTKNVKKFGHLEYSIIDQGIPFVMDSNRVVVSDSTKMDYELKVNKYTFNVQVMNCALNAGTGKYTDHCLADTAKVVVEIQDEDEVPKIIVDDDDDGDDDTDSLCIANCDTTDRGSDPKKPLTVGIKENSANGTVVFEYFIYDEDAGDLSVLIPSIEHISANVDDSKIKATDLFEIRKDSLGQDKWKISVRVSNSALLDYEALRQATSHNDPNPKYTVRVIVSEPDTYKSGLSDTLIRAIEVLDVNEKPTFDVWPCEIAENNSIGDSLGRIEHPSDIDSMARPENVNFYDNMFKLVGGDTALFDLAYGGPLDIKLIAKVEFDCENGIYQCEVEGAYHVILDYFDRQNPSIKMTKKIPITLRDVNEKPEILTDFIEVAENSKKGTVVDTIDADDVDRYDTVLTFNIIEDNSKCFDIGKHSGVVTVKTDNCAALDYEKNTKLLIKVKVTDTKGDTDIKTVTVKIKDVNEPPHIDDQVVYVSEDSKVNTVVDTVQADDPDKDPKYRDLTYTAIDGDTTVFEVDPKTGELILKDTLDYENKKEYFLIVQVDDGEFADTATVKIKVKNVEESTDVVIIKYEDTDTTYNYPDTVFTNKPNPTITWVQEGDTLTMDTILTPGKNVVVVSYKDPTKDYPGHDTLIIFYSNASPEVSVSASADEVLARNIYTIVEKTDKSDTNIYVNNSKNDVRVTVRDSVTKTDSTFIVKLDLDTLDVPASVYKKLDKIIEESVALNELSTRGVVKTPTNGVEVLVTYKEVIGGDTVEVAYKTDNRGDVVKAPVVNAKGKVDSIEVITVSYYTEINDKMVKVSYQADAVTGTLLVQDAEGNLMTESTAAKTSKKKGRKSTDVSRFLITYEYEDAAHNTVVVAYGVDDDGSLVRNAEGDKGYSVSYTYVNKYGNAATQSVFIVLDQIGPTVKILSPEKGVVLRSNFVNVVWTVNGEEQDTLTVQGLEKGYNPIVRFYRDKAGNEASDTVYVFMKDGKNVDIAVEQPVTEITRDKVDEFYATNTPEPGQTFAVSIRNPSTEEEVETLIGGSFKTKKGSEKTPYPGLEDKGHLGPTLDMEIRLPTVSDVGGLATLDDLLSADGLVPLDGVDAENSDKITVESYVKEYCADDFMLTNNLEELNLYESKMDIKIWVYTSLGNFVDYFSFTQDLNDPSYSNEAGMLQMFFEMKPDRDGNMRTEDGRLYATGAYLYKVEAKVRSKLRCTLPPVKDEAGKKKGDVIKSDDDLLKPFGYKRPQSK